MGWYQLVFCFIVLMYSAAIAVMGIWETMMLLDKYDSIQSSEEPMTKTQGYMFFALGFVIGLGAWLSSMSVGGTMDEQIEWFLDY